MHKPHRVFLILFTVIIASIAIRAEYLNYKAGWYLPRDRSIDIGKWRSSTITTEARWRIAHRMRDDQDNPTTQPLTASEQEQMLADIDHAHANNDLRDWIGSAGLLQYVLLLLYVPLVFLAIAKRANRYENILTTIAVTTLLFASASLLYRQYFSSLGW